MKRLIEKTVFSGLVMAWRFATWPTNRSPLLVKATTDGVVRAPSWFAMTVGWPASITATTELVVPKSMPIILPMLLKFLHFRIAIHRGGNPDGLVQSHYQTLVSDCQVFFHAVQQDLNQGWVSFQRRGDLDLNPWMLGGQVRDNPGQVPFEMDPQGE